jgi:hypothetical protein
MMNAYLPPAKSRLKDRFVHAQLTFEPMCANATALPKLRSSHAACPKNVALWRLA